MIFSTILNWHYTIENEFEKGIQKLKDGVIAATLDIFNEAKNKLLPTPTKSHYTFNLRDYARVIQVQISCQVIAYDDVIEIVEYIYTPLSDTPNTLPPGSSLKWSYLHKGWDLMWSLFLIWHLHLSSIWQGL